MPLFKRKTWELAEAPADVDSDEEVFVMRCTGEVFPSYEAYAQRLMLYLDRVWQCGVTQRTGLTFEEALESERQSSESVALQDHHKERLAHLTHHSPLRLDALARHARLLIHFSFEVGESVFVVDNDKPEHNSATVLARLDELPAELSKQTAENIRYECDVNGTKHTFRFSQLMHACVLPNQADLKVAIRQIAQRDAATNKFWVCHSDIARAYGLPELAPSPSGSLPPSNGVEASEPSAKRRKLSSSKIVYPIEDALVHGAELGKKKKQKSCAYPTPSNDFPAEAAVVELALPVWDLLHLFSEHLRLSRFHLFTFLEALTSRERTPNPLLDHCVFALLCVLVPKSHIKHNAHQTRQAELAWMSKGKSPYVESESDSAGGGEAEEEEEDEGEESAEESSEGEDNEQDDNQSQESSSEGEQVDVLPPLTLVEWQAYMAVWLEMRAKRESRAKQAPKDGNEEEGGEGEDEDEGKGEGEGKEGSKGDQSVQVPKANGLANPGNQAQSQPTPDQEWVEKTVACMRKGAFYHLEPVDKVGVLAWLCDRFLSLSVARQLLARLLDAQKEVSLRHVLAERKERERLRGANEKARVELGEKFKQSNDAALLRGLMDVRVRLPVLGQDRDFNVYSYHPGLPEFLLVCNHDYTAWRVFNQEADLEALAEWLDERGIRERALKRSLEAHRGLIVRGMQSGGGLEHVSQMVVVRRSERIQSQSKAGFLCYVNKLR